MSQHGDRRPVLQLCSDGLVSGGPPVQRERPTQPLSHLFFGLGLVPFLVQRQVIGPAERAVACLADKRLSSGVFANVSGQLVGAGEAPVAALPRAQVRLLS